MAVFKEYSLLSNLQQAVDPRLDIAMHRVLPGMRMTELLISGIGIIAIVAASTIQAITTLLRHRILLSEELDGMSNAGRFHLI